MRASAKILTALAKATEPQTRYQLWKAKACRNLSADTIYYDWLPRMEAIGWVEAVKSESSESEKYRITDLGLLRAVRLNPELSKDKDVTTRLKGKIETFEENLRRADSRRIEKVIEKVREALTGKTPPGWELNLRIQADKGGRVKSRLRYGFPIRGQRRRERGEAVESF